MMTTSNVAQRTDRTNAHGELPELVASERIVPVWLSLDDIDLVRRSLGRFAPTCESDAELRLHVADLRNHFDWVRREFIAGSTRSVI